MRKTVFWSTPQHVEESTRHRKPPSGTWTGVSWVMGWHVLNFPLGLLVLVMMTSPDILTLSGILKYTFDVFPSFLGVTQLVYVVPMVIYLMAKLNSSVLRGVLLAGCLTCIVSLVYYLGLRLLILDFFMKQGWI